MLLEPYGRGANLKALLTETSGVDESLIDLMRPLLAAGVKPARISRILLECHSKEHTREHLRYEHELTRCKHEFPQGNGSSPPQQPQMFSSFTDKSFYAGAVPSGNYLGSIFKRHGALIKDHLAAEVKKRGAEHLNWDVSYKVTKRLRRYHGHSIFKGLVTATNNFGEIRVQFFVVTDGHDQMKQARTLAAPLSLARRATAHHSNHRAHNVCRPSSRCGRQ